MTFWSDVTPVVLRTPRVSGRVTRRPLWLLGLLLLTLLVGVRTVTVVREINQYRVTLLLLADTTSAINRHSALEWQVIGGAFLDHDLRQSVTESRARVQQLLGRLKQDVPSWASATGPVQDQQAALLRAIDQEFLFVDQGDLVSARGVHDTRLVPILVTLEHGIARARGVLERRAQATLNVAALVTVLMLVCFTLTVLGLGQQLTRSRLHAQKLERERREEREREERDSLTGLWNRRGVQRRYEQHQGTGDSVLLMLDLNRLKVINDRGGHAAGDAHLRRVAAALVAASGPQGAVARWGGDEFLVWLPGLTLADAVRVADQAAGLLPEASDRFPPFAYGAVACVPATPLERAVALADAAMYEHKELQYQTWADRHTDLRLGTSTEQFGARLEQLDTPREVLVEGLALARHLLDFNGSAYWERSGDQVILSQLGGEVTEDARLQYEGMVLGPEHHLIHRAVLQGQTVWSSDYSSETGAVAAWVQMDLNSVVAVPVHAGDQVMGVVVLLHFGAWRAVTPQVRRLMETLARRLGHTYDHVRAAEDVKRALEGGLLALGVALEERDLETSGHTERVVHLAEALGRRLNLAGPRLEALRQGAFLHDIGKLSIPDAVLLKPGALTPEEWEIMRGHTTRGDDIARRLSGLMPSTLEVIRHHHEKWDGSGYPDGLMGEAIPAAARLFAVCDVYDALTHARPYKRAWSHDEAAAELRAQRGRHFDPAVVDAFLEVVAPAPAGGPIEG